MLPVFAFKFITFAPRNQMEEMENKQQKKRGFLRARWVMALGE
jgi:hypothetical protein